jgi:hypothetical protein
VDPTSNVVIAADYGKRRLVSFTKGRSSVNCANRAKTVSPIITASNVTAVRRRS